MQLLCHCGTVHAVWEATMPHAKELWLSRTYVLHAESLIFYPQYFQLKLYKVIDAGKSFLCLRPGKQTILS